MSEEKRLTRRRVIGTAAAGSAGIAGAFLGIPTAAEAAAVREGGAGERVPEQEQLASLVLSLKVEDRPDVGGFFTEVSGLGSETEVVEYRSGGERGAGIVRKMPGASRFGDITLKRGITQSTGLWDWRRAIIEGKVERHNGSLSVRDVQNNEVARWNFENAWPSKVYAQTEPGELGAAMLVEELTLVVEYLERTA